MCFKLIQLVQKGNLRTKDGTKSVEVIELNDEDLKNKNLKNKNKIENNGKDTKK